MYKILTPGQKIKEIRNVLGLNQQDIVGDQVTRNLISLIENDKSNLSPAVARIVAENINQICKARGLSYSVSESYLLESTGAQINRIVEEFIKYLDSSDVITDSELLNKIKEIDSLFVDYSVPSIEFRVYFKIGRVLGDRKDYLTSYAYYIRALENNTASLGSIDGARLLSDLGYTCLRLNRCDEALKYINLALYYLDDTTSRLYFVLHYNAALAYKKEAQYDYAFNEIKIIEETCSAISIEDMFDVYSLKANCFEAVKRYEEALSVHEMLYSSIDSDNIESKLFALGNMLDIYSLLDDTKSMSETIEKSEEFLHKYKFINNPIYSSDIYNQFGNAYFKLNNYKRSLEYYWEALLTAKVSNKTSILSTSINRIVDIYALDKNLEDIDTIKNLVIEYISEDLISLDNLVIYKLIKLYTDRNDIGKVNSILEFILNNKKEIVT
jgi:HTH-type transcriptional regulator, quorum sensing regulator NprR